eukprot:m.38164 g.38164  ORF g.38164 m.38164 type:complete len:244 (+) comp10165_c0_seq1:87-818(+)
MAGTLMTLRYSARVTVEPTEKANAPNWVEEGTLVTFRVGDGTLRQEIEDAVRGKMEGSEVTLHVKAGEDLAMRLNSIHPLTQIEYFIKVIVSQSLEDKQQSLQETEIMSRGTIEKIVQVVQRVKAKASDLFKAGRFAHALAAFEAALHQLNKLTHAAAASIKDLQVALLFNCSMCAFKLQNWDISQQYATKCLALEPGHSKAKFRKAFALTKLGHTVAAKVLLSTMAQTLQVKRLLKVIQESS